MSQPYPWAHDQGKVYKGVGQEEVWESHLMLPGVQKNVREWTLTLPSEFPFWELKSQMES